MILTYVCVLQPLEALRPGMRREFMVVEGEEQYGQVICSLAAMEVSFVPVTRHAVRATRRRLRVTGWHCHCQLMSSSHACQALTADLVSNAHVQATVFWQRIRQLQEEDIIVNVLVDSANKGGMLVKYGVYDGFVPVSQIGSVSSAVSKTMYSRHAASLAVASIGAA